MKKRNGGEQGHKVSNRKAAGCVQGKLIPRLYRTSTLQNVLGI